MILDEILTNTRSEVRERQSKVPIEAIRRHAEQSGPPRDFAAALQGSTVALIAEIKRASPSRGSLREIKEPVSIAQEYAMSGAAAISVLTDSRYFRGSLDDLLSVRGAVSLPVLRKDFTLTEYQVFESKAETADAILLIVRALDDPQMRDYLSLAEGLGLSAVVEVHDEGEVERALKAGARIVGINNRNLADFTVDLATTERLARYVPADRILVAESGVHTRGDVDRVAQVGVNAILVGEALMRSTDMKQAVRELTAVQRNER